MSTVSIVGADEEIFSLKRLCSNSFAFSFPNFNGAPGKHLLVWGS